MSQTLKIRTFTDSVRTGLYKSIITGRKASRAVQFYGKVTIVATKLCSKDLMSAAKQAWNADLK